MKSIKIKKLDINAEIPFKATDYSSGFDLISIEDKLLKTKCYDLIATGISIEMEPGMEAQVRPRSGLAFKNGITVLNSPGTIDADYRGEIKVILINHSNEDFKITKGMRIAQLIFSQIIETELVIVNELNSTKRNDGGFGSTGVK